MDMTIPMMVISLSGTNTNHTNDDRSNAQSHKNAAAIKIIIRIGSCAIVIVNIANGGPNAKNAHPKNSGNVIASISSLPNLVFQSRFLYTVLISNDDRWPTESLLIQYDNSE